jgi:hypothetical protein
MSTLDRVISKAESIIESIRAQEGLSVKSVDKKQDSSTREETAKTPVTIKVPLSPRLQTRGKRRHSSGSDESIILSQNGLSTNAAMIDFFNLWYVLQKLHLSRVMLKAGSVLYKSSSEGGKWKRRG